MAFIPGRRRNVGRDSFLSRPRFLGLSEFGPHSIIYHEGSTYRVRRTILSPHDEAGISTSAKLPVQWARICPECGYGHFGNQDEYERCSNCDELLEGGRTICNLYRIEQVSTPRANRITSDEEERQRQGFEMITTLRFSEENGRRRIESVSITESEETLLEASSMPRPLHFGVLTSDGADVRVRRFMASAWIPTLANGPRIPKHRPTRKTTRLRGKTSNVSHHSWKTPVTFF